MWTNKIIVIFDTNLKILIVQNDTVIHTEVYSLSKVDIIDGIIFNITKIEKLIASALNKHNVSAPKGTIVLKGNLINEILNKDLELDTHLYHIKSYELQFYPELVFYKVGIKHYQLFQYYLLCAKLGIQLESITTALVHLHSLFKACSYDKIDSTIITIDSLEKFFKKAIKESTLQDSVCGLTKKFDTLLSLY